MMTLKGQLVRVAAVCVGLACLAVLPALGAQDHVVSPSDLQRATVAASTARAQNVRTVTQFLSSPRAEKVLESAHVNSTQVKTAMAKMSGAEVAQLASRVEKSQADFAAGSISDRDLIWIIVGLVALILIIVAVR